MNELTQELESLLAKFPTIHVIDCYKADSFVIIHTSVSDTYVLYKLLNVFYFGNTPWKCSVSNCILSDYNETRVNLNVCLDVRDWDKADIKREIDYKVCLLKSTYESITPPTKGA